MSTASQSRMPTFTADGVRSRKLERVKEVERAGNHPLSYQQNTNKEEICLEYVHNFNKQFVELFPHRRPLFLTALNEAGVKKFVCTTVKPTQLPFRDLYDHTHCAQFFANFFTYEPLENPTALPRYLPSASAVLTWQAGDCFDLATVLASFLIGSGYDAYVVYGIAPKSVTLRDQSKMACPFLSIADEEESKGGEDEDSKQETPDADPSSNPALQKYQVGDDGPPQSKYLLAMQQRAAEKASEAAAPVEMDVSIEEDEEPDPLDGQRVHAWVLVRAGPRGVDEHLFIEPSTGTVYPIADAPYQAIEAVWNHKNYWVNMQEFDDVVEASNDTHEEKDLLAPDHPGAPKPPTKLMRMSAMERMRLSAAVKAEEESRKRAEEDGAEPPAETIAEEAEGGEPAEGGEEVAEQEASNPEAEAEEELNEEAPQEESQPATSAGAAAIRRGIAALGFDLENAENWEFVFFEVPLRAEKRGDGKEEGQEGGEDGLDSANNAGGEEGGNNRAQDNDILPQDRENILDVPPSWIRPLKLDEDMYHLEFGKSGVKTTYFHKTKVEQYAKHVHNQGMVLRLSIFTDVERRILERVVELYERRADHLRKRIRYPMQHRIEEYFLPGRQFGLKKFIDIAGCRREMEFYVSARLDSLERRVEEIGKKIMLWYRSHDERLSYRSVTFVQPEDDIPSALSTTRYTARSGVSTSRGRQPAARGPSGMALSTEAGELYVKKMSEKYDRDDSKPAYQDPAKIVYFTQKGEIDVRYHYAPGRITATQRKFRKDKGPGEVITRSVDPFAPKPKDSELAMEYRDMLEKEKECAVKLRSAQRNVAEIMKKRRAEEASVELVKTVFEIARERAKEGGKKEEEIKEEEEEEEEDSDFLAPFLKSDQPTKEEALRAEKACRRALKERLVERVNIIRRRLDEENEKLHKKQQEFSRSRDQVEGAEEEFEKFCADAMFRIGILEQRLHRQEDIVYAKYTELNQKLLNDPRLAILHGGK